MSLGWKWEEQSPTDADYGNANQFTVGGGIDSLARETAQNSNDARLPEQRGELRFSFIPLSGDTRAEFERRIDWPNLRTHLAAMAENNQVVTAGIRDGLEYLESTDELLLLRIEDRFCQGLTGPELLTADESEFGNFIKLCRTNLFSGKAQAAGGSFGLGKAVYWRFSRLQTVLFNSHLSVPYEGHSENRLFGVNQGAVHRLDGKLYAARGFYGSPDDNGYVRSSFVSDSEADELFLDRPSGVPGTSALIVGFWDPDNPDHGVTDFVGELEGAIQEFFWPLITRRGMDLYIDVMGDEVSTVRVDPEPVFTELVYALRTYDEGGEAAELGAVGDVVVRDIPIQVPKRKSEPRHEPFTHEAKLVVTLSDDQEDRLENRICLLRGPEMVVETLFEEFPNITYHAFLLAGRAVDPTSDDEKLRLADDFLRIAEPPSHDRWIPPQSGSLRTSLAANYVAPYVKNLRDIRDAIKRELRELFGIIREADDRPPEALAKMLRVIATGPPVRIGKPHLTIDAASVEGDSWVVVVRAVMKNRPEGWRFRPVPRFVGVEGGEPIGWAHLEPVSNCAIEGGYVLVDGAPGAARTLRATFRGVTDPATHPIPAFRSALDVTAAEPGPLLVEATV